MVRGALTHRIFTDHIHLACADGLGDYAQLVIVPRHDAEEHHPALQAAEHERD
jgi:hypothetical protein